MKITDSITQFLGGSTSLYNAGRALLTSTTFYMNFKSLSTTIKNGPYERTFPMTKGLPTIPLLISNPKDVSKQRQLNFVIATGFNGTLTIDQKLAKQLELSLLDSKVLLSSIWTPPTLCGTALVKISLSDVFTTEVMVTIIPSAEAT